MSEEYAQPPFIDLALPPAIVLSHLQLIAFYTLSITLDVTLLKKQKELPFTSKQLTVFLVLIRTLLPLIFISSNMLLNVLYAAVPWFLASYYTRLPVSQLSLSKAIQTLVLITTEPTSLPLYKIRCRGAATCCLGILKWTFMLMFIDPLLPHRTVFALYYSWFHPMSLIYTLLYGIKAYCLLGAIDFCMGLEQVVFGLNMVSLFNSPILSISPRDFWSKRWNKVVRNLLHKQVFTLAVEQEKKSARKYKKGWSGLLNHRYGRGLASFFVSGLFHELIIMSVCRRLTLENLVFFSLQGLAVLFEINLRQGALKQEPERKSRAICIAAQIMFMACTGRLFLGPFLRYLE